MNSILKKVIGEGDLMQTGIDPQEAAHDRAVVAAAIEQIKERFIQERMRGVSIFDPGQHVAPCSRGEAEARWERCARNFTQTVKRIADKPPGFSKKLGIKGSGEEMRYKHPEAQ